MYISISIFGTLLSAPLGLYTEWELLDHVVILLNHMGFLGGSVVKNACHCRSYRRGRFDPWGGKIPWKRKWQLTPVFLPGESPWTEDPLWATVHGVSEESDTTE